MKVVTGVRKRGRKPYLDDDGNQECGEGMIMPDGTKLNRGKGFDYKGTSLGFYMDADVLVGDWNGYNGGLHTNDDDFMKYYWDIFEVNNDRMLISMAMIGDMMGSLELLVILLMNLQRLRILEIILGWLQLSYLIHQEQLIL